MTPLAEFPGTVPTDIKGIRAFLQQLSRVRKTDQTFWNSLDSQFVVGRKVTKLPSSSSDIADSAAGDFNVDSSFAYFCINNGGTVQWVRVAVASF